MQRHLITPRPGWQRFAERVGFCFHTLNGETYWDESAWYSFTLQQIEEDLEAPTEELHQMALDLVSELIGDEQALDRLAIPPDFRHALAQSWQRGDPHLYGRMDLCYNGHGPAKLLELNYDTPTSLYESGFFQWIWLEDQQYSDGLPKQADQFNSLQEKLEQAFAQLPLPQPFYFSSVAASDEDRGTVQYLMDIAIQAGVDARYITMEALGANDGQLVDEQGRAVHGLFKLYPWEFMVEEAYGVLVQSSQTLWLEPLWKLLLSNKGILPLLWERHPGHPNLLPAHFDERPDEPLPPGWVRKPLFSREGANIELVTAAGERYQADGPYPEGPWIRQAYQPLPVFDGNHTVIGSWVVGDYAAGIGIREDRDPITRDSSRFLPHAIIE